jgi:hypothetical protein
MLKTNLRGGMNFLWREGILEVDDALEANRDAFGSTFVK